MVRRWLESEELAALAAEGTDACRVWSGRAEWIERFGDDFLISADRDPAELGGELREWAGRTAVTVRRIFWRQLVKQPGAADVPQLVHGPTDVVLETECRERGLRFGIDFGAGYSVGLFCDQRENRAYLESLRPRRVLNCFAYTCAFSVAAAHAGAGTVSVDLSKRALGRGKANFERNGLGLDGHRFLADDVFAVLARLARRGERFDVVILDPPTFSRDERGRVFRAVDDFGRLIALAAEVLADAGRMLLSTNARGLGVPELVRAASGLVVDGAAPVGPGDLPGTSATVWMRVD